MTLTNAQIRSASGKVKQYLLKRYGHIPFGRDDIDQAVVDTDAWQDSVPVKQDYNSNLTAGNFKTNGTEDDKRFLLGVVLDENVPS